MRGYSGSGLVWVPQYNLRAGGAGGVRGPRRVSAGYKRQQSSGPRAAGEGGGPHSGSRGWRRARRADGASLRRMSRRARQRWDGPVAGRPMERQSHARELQGCDRTSVFDGVPARAGIVFLARARVGDSPGVRGCRGYRGTGRVRRGRGCRPALARSRGLSRHVSRSGPFRSLSAGDLVRTISRAARSHTPVTRGTRRGSGFLPSRLVRCLALGGGAVPGSPHCWVRRATNSKNSGEYSTFWRPYDG